MHYSERKSGAALCLIRLMLCAGIIFFVSGCGNDSQVVQDLQGCWTLTEAPGVLGEAIADDGENVTLKVNDREVEGSMPCNSYVTSLTDRDFIFSTDLQTTVIGCYQEIQRLDGAYLGLLHQVNEVIRSDEKLVLSTTTGETLVFKPCPQE